MEKNFLHYIPILTTLISAWFCVELYKHYRSKPEAKYILWWFLGVLFYGIGTLIESSVSLLGWSSFLFKSWYIFGAFLGGLPLALGTAHLLWKPKNANWATWISIAVVILGSILVILSPINYDLVESHRLSGKVIEWSKIRLISPFINVFAFLLLVGGAIQSAIYYFRKKSEYNRFIGNVFIAIGGTLPGIGGSMAKGDLTEALYVGEFLGLILIIIGYRIIRYKYFKNEFNSVKLS